MNSSEAYLSTTVDRKRSINQSKIRCFMLLIVPKLGVVYDVVGMAKMCLAMGTHIPSILHHTSATGSPPPPQQKILYETLCSNLHTVVET